VFTGAGKTNIAMISVLREVSLNMRYGVIQKGDFKIVYVAPMKALAAEVTANFSKRLEPLGKRREGLGRQEGGRMPSQMNLPVIGSYFLSEWVRYLC
jgi:Lhr-like helicase